MLAVDSLSKSFGGARAVSDVSFEVRENEYVTLLGASGAGKSVLLRMIAGLLTPDKGKVKLRGKNVNALPCHMRKIGFVQQKYALFPHLNVFDNIAFGLRNRTDNQVRDDGEVRRKVNAMIELVGLGGQEGKMTGQISGGQKQRVSLARTLVTEPSVCLLDEPLGALDANLRERMTIELQNIRSELGISFMHVTGNEFEALAMGQKMLVMSEGRIVQQGRPQTLYAKPDNLVTARNMHSFNIFSGGRMAESLKAGTKGAKPAAKARKAGHCAIPVDRIDIAAGTGKGGLAAEFITSEFLGSRIIYFFKLGDGGICEVEDHLSLKKQRILKVGSTYRLSWKAGDVLLFGDDSRLIGRAAG